MDVGFKILLAHLVGDYIFQSHTMAQKKTSHTGWALAHASIYSVAYLPLVDSEWAYLTILITHFLIDRFRLARFVNYAKNPSMWGKPVTATGYPEETPAWLSVWLLIIADNTLHLLIGYLSVTLLSN